MSIKKDLYIIGASHLGREIETLLDRIPESQRDWIIRGFLHSYTDKSPLDGHQSDYQILGSWEDYPLTKEDYCIIAVADCLWKEKLYVNIATRATIFTYIDATSIVGKFTDIGEGSILGPHTHLSTGSKLGKMVFINGGSQIGHDCVIGDYTSIMSQVELGGGCKVGSRVLIGSHANLIPNIVVEDDAIIGAGSIVIKRVKTHTTVFGNPAVRLFTNER